MTRGQSPFVATLMDKLLARDGLVDDDAYLDIVRALVCDSLEASIDIVDRMAREARLRGNSEIGLSRYINSDGERYRIFAPYIDDHRRLLAIQGDVDGYLLALDLDNQVTPDVVAAARRQAEARKERFSLDDFRVSQLRKLAKPEVLTAYRYDPVRETHVSPDLPGLLEEVRRGIANHAIAVTGTRKCLDEDKDVWSRATQRIIDADRWPGLLRAIHAAAIGDDLVGSLTQELEDQFRRSYIESGDPKINAAIEVAMKLGAVDHSLDAIADDGAYRLRLLKDQIDRQLRQQAAPPFLTAQPGF